MQVDSEGFDKIYCYGNSHILINKNNIKNMDELQIVERKKISVRLAELSIRPVKGNLDYQHLKDIHKAIFQDIYEWAGKERIVDIAKSNMFCRVMFINDMASDIFGKYQNENYLLGDTKEHISERLAFYLGEINALHPFREGNGRSQREFIRCAASVAGYQMNWSQVSPDLMLEASIESFDCNYDKMIRIFRQGLQRISYREQFSQMEKIADKKGPLGYACSEYCKKISRIKIDLKKNGYIPNDNAIRCVENFERIVQKECSVRELSVLRKEEGEIGSAAGKVLDDLQTTSGHYVQK